jgi:hypothetical protein
MCFYHGFVLNLSVFSTAEGLMDALRKQVRPKGAFAGNGSLRCQNITSMPQREPVEFAAS